MKHKNVRKAFDTLLGELDSALATTREQAATASRQGRYAEAQARLGKAVEIEKFIAEIRAKQRAWAAIGGMPRQNRRVAGARLPRGERTHEKAYCLPILRALDAFGGEARMSQVLERVYAEMKPRLKPVDLKPLASDARTSRWRNSAQWARQAMVNEGLLRKGSLRGIWAITESGRKHLAQHAV